VTVLANVDPRWHGVSPHVAQWTVRRVVGTGLVKAMMLAKKAAKDPLSSHAQRLRMDPFYSHTLIPALVAHCKSKGWEPPYVPIPSVPYNASSLFKKSSQTSNPFHRLHRRMMKKMHRKKSRKGSSGLHLGYEDDMGSGTDDGATLSAASTTTSQHSNLSRSPRYQSIQSDVLRRMFIERQQQANLNSLPLSPSSSWGGSSLQNTRSRAAVIFSISVIFPLVVLLLSSWINLKDGAAVVFVRRHAGTPGLMAMSAVTHLVVVYAITSCSVRALVRLRGPAAAVSLAHTIRFGVGIVMRLSLVFASVVCVGCTVYAGFAELGRNGAPGEWMERALENAQGWMNHAASFFALTMISVEVFLFYPRKVENVEAAAEAIGMVIEKKRPRKDRELPRVRIVANVKEDGEKEGLLTEKEVLMRKSKVGM